MPRKGLRISKGSKLCCLSDGRWLTYRSTGYYLGEHRLQAETALIILMEECEKDYRVRPRLRRSIPTDDYGIIDRDPFVDYQPELGIPTHERYLIEMMKATEPPARDWPQDFEAIHRAALSEDLSDKSLSRQIPLLDRLYWHPIFGAAIRNHRPARSPLTHWIVVTQLTGCKPKDNDEDRGLRTERIWAYSEWRIRSYATFEYREVVSLRQMPVGSFLGWHRFERPGDETPHLLGNRLPEK